MFNLKIALSCETIKFLFIPHLAMNKQTSDTFVFICIPDGYCKKFGNAKHFIFEIFCFNGIVSQTTNSSNTLFSIFA